MRLNFHHNGVLTPGNLKPGRVFKTDDGLQFVVRGKATVEGVKSFEGLSPTLRVVVPAQMAIPKGTQNSKRVYSTLGRPDTFVFDFTQEQGRWVSDGFTRIRQAEIELRTTPQNAATARHAEPPVKEAYLIDSHGHTYDPRTGHYIGVNTGIDPHELLRKARANWGKAPDVIKVGQDPGFVEGATTQNDGINPWGKLRLVRRKPV
ncbi:MAG: hypothetical protein IPK79_10945 [Vampirovibrionales bacterium]|nr:hypothetical protein [Vampirovibrionales bacterium]